MGGAVPQLQLQGGIVLMEPAVLKRNIPFQIREGGSHTKEKKPPNKIRPALTPLDDKASRVATDADCWEIGWKCLQPPHLADGSDAASGDCRGRVDDSATID